MTEDSSGERMWSDGESVFRVATVGVRLFAGFLDWIFTAGVAAILGLVVTTVYNGVVADERIVSYWGVSAIVVTVVHVAPAFMVVRRGDKPGYNALRLLVKRDDGERIGWRRALARGLLGSPALTVPWLAIGIQNVIVLLVETFDGYGFEFWSTTLMATWIPVLMLVVLNHAWMIFDAKRRGLHDLIVGTVVVGGQIVRRDPDALTTLAADRTRGDLDYPAAHRVF